MRRNRMGNRRMKRQKNGRREYQVEKEEEEKMEV